jgi:predicted Zn-dependent protease
MKTGRKSKTRLLLLVVGLAATCASGSETLELRSAVQPLDEGVPEVAVARIQKLLQTNLPNEERRSAMVKLGEALVAAGDAQAALRILNDSRVQGHAAANFWRAQALAALNRWEEALANYALAAGQESPLRSSAWFGKAEALRALDRKEEALKVFTTLFDDQQWGLRARFRAAEIFLDQRDAESADKVLAKAQARSTAEKHQRRFLRARVHVALNRPERAIELFKTILKSEQTSHAMLIGALFAVSDLHLQLKTPDSAHDVLENFIEGHPADPELARVFAKLDRVYQAERKPSRQQLARWVRDPAQPRRALAQWYLARSELRIGHRESALGLFRALQNGAVKLSALTEAYLEFAQLEIEDGRFDDALATLNAARRLPADKHTLARIDWLAAVAQYQARQFAVAAQHFEKIGHSSVPFANEALFNAALGWIQVGNDARFSADQKTLGERSPNDDSRAELLLERGLVQAAQGDEKAVASLKSFLRDFPQNKRVSEAWVALGELAFHESPPRLDQARDHLKRAMESQPTAAATERADYLKIWIEDSAPGPEETNLIALANQFLQKHATSRFVPDVRMKLAEAYYRRQDFPNAQTQFELLVQQDPNGSFAEKALFFAAESAMAGMRADSLDRALTLLNEVVRRDGELKWAARNEQAVIERKLGKPKEALLLYDEVLKENAKAGEKREALCGKGDIYFEMGPADPQNYKRAIEHYDRLIDDPEAPPHWRNQALFKKGVCLEKTANLDDALAVFYRVLENEGRLDRPREFFWFYKSGFNAARLLEEQLKWSSAVAVYQKLVAAGGMRSEEAQGRLRQLRLEHFLWEE